MLHRQTATHVIFQPLAQRRFNSDATSHRSEPLPPQLSQKQSRLKLAETEEDRIEPTLTAPTSLTPSISYVKNFHITFFTINKQRSLKTSYF